MYCRGVDSTVPFPYKMPSSSDQFKSTVESWLDKLLQMRTHVKAAARAYCRVLKVYDFAWTKLLVPTLWSHRQKVGVLAIKESNRPLNEIPNWLHWQLLLNTVQDEELFK